MTIDFEHALHGRFLRGAALSPDRVAIRDGDRSITYQEAHEFCLSWAGSLLRACTDAPKAIGVLAEREPMRTSEFSPRSSAEYP